MLTFVYSPTPEVTWKRLDKPLPSKTYMEDNGMALAIPQVDWDDEGQYRCEAVTPNMPNMLGEPVHHDFDLVVECEYRKFTARLFESQASMGPLAIPTFHSLIETSHFGKRCTAFV